MNKKENTHVLYSIEGSSSLYPANYTHIQYTHIPPQVFILPISNGEKETQNHNTTCTPIQTPCVALHVVTIILRSMGQIPLYGQNTTVVKTCKQEGGGLTGCLSVCLLVCMHVYFYLVVDMD